MGTGTSQQEAVNDFAECLRMSHDAHNLPIWEEIYRKAFPDMVSMSQHPDNGWWQTAGVDRVIVLSSGKCVRVDEKIRGRNKVTGRVYGDICIEYVSSDKAGTPGWAEKPLWADYIAYAIAPLGVGYLLPVQQLQLAWKANKQEWIRRFGSRAARNNGYNTLFCPVSVAELFPAIGKQLRIQFSPVDWNE